MNRFLGNILASTLLFLICTNTLHAGTTRHDPERDSLIHISVGGILSYSTINMGVEPGGLLCSGLGARLNVKFKRRIGLSAEFTNQTNHSALPAWGNIGARNFDLNLHYLYLHAEETKIMFYGILGISVQQWTGTYQGVPVFEQDIYDYTPGEVRKFIWPAANLGFGFERYFKQVAVFGEFKFRIGQDFHSDPLEIVDVNLAIGIKLNLVDIGDYVKTAPGVHKHARKMGIKPKIYRWF